MLCTCIETIDTCTCTLCTCTVCNHSLNSYLQFSLPTSLLPSLSLSLQLLFIVDECCQLLSDVDSSTDKVAHAGLLALKLLESTLNKQESFLSILRESPTHSIMATPLNDLLLGINPRSHKADHYINIAKYACIYIILFLLHFLHDLVSSWSYVKL